MNHIPTYTRAAIAVRCAFFACFLVGTAIAQQAPPAGQSAPQKEKPEIEVTKFRVEPAQAPGGGKPWLRLLADFSSAPAWADGIAFYYDVLLVKGSDYRVISGTARYSNVKRGNHSAVLYMSPGAVERFGAPVAANVRTSYKDESSGEISWSEPGKAAPDGWAKQFQRYPNQLLPISLTPFVATEYGKYPDAIVTR
jgi:hypothetical protein